MTSDCQRCGKPERGFDARYRWSTKRFAASRGQAKNGRFCHPCSQDVAREKNQERSAMASFPLCYRVGSGDSRSANATPGCRGPCHLPSSRACLGSARLASCTV